MSVDNCWTNTFKSKDNRGLNLLVLFLVSKSWWTKTNKLFTIFIKIIYYLLVVVRLTLIRLLLVLHGCGCESRSRSVSVTSSWMLSASSVSSGVSPAARNYAMNLISKQTSAWREENTNSWHGVVNITVYQVHGGWFMHNLIWQKPHL